MGETRALLAAALGPGLGGFAADAAGIAIAYAFSPAREKDLDAYLGKRWDRIEDPAKVATSYGDLRLLLDQVVPTRGSRAPGDHVMALGPLGRSIRGMLVKRGHLGLLRWFQHRHGTAEDYESIIESAARWGQLSILRWASAKGGVWTTAAGMFAAEGGHTLVLEWARSSGRLAEHGEPTQIYERAAACGRLGVLRWARLWGLRWGRSACTTAACNGQLAALQWLRAEGCPWHESMMCEDALDGADPDVLHWVLLVGCAPSPCERIEVGASDNGVALMRELHLAVRGCPFEDRSVCLRNLVRHAMYFVDQQADCDRDVDDSHCWREEAFPWKDDPLFTEMAFPGTASEWSELEARLEAFAVTHSQPRATETPADELE